MHPQSPDKTDGKPPLDTIFELHADLSQRARVLTGPRSTKADQDDALHDALELVGNQLDKFVADRLNSWQKTPYLLFRDNMVKRRPARALTTFTALQECVNLGQYIDQETGGRWRVQEVFAGTYEGLRGGAKWRFEPSSLIELLGEVREFCGEARTLAEIYNFSRRDRKKASRWVKKAVFIAAILAGFTGLERHLPIAGGDIVLFARVLRRGLSRLLRDKKFGTR